MQQIMKINVAVCFFTCIAYNIIQHGRDLAVVLVAEGSCDKV